MAIRFRCQRCAQLLAIGARKAGSEIQCPKCGTSQIVPSEEAAAAALALSQPAETDVAVDVFDDLAVGPAMRPSNDPSYSLPTDPPAAPNSAAPVPAPPVSRPAWTPIVPNTSRAPFHPRTSPHHAWLWVAVALGMFAAGFLLGRCDFAGEAPSDVSQPAPEPVLLEGRLVYYPTASQIAGDENGVVIALVEGRFPPKKISYEGLRPEDDSSADRQRAMRAIRDLGGTCVRAGASGEFSTTLPAAGTYRLLAISRHADRPSGAEIDEADLAEMSQYFRLPDFLIGRHKYRWTREEIQSGRGPRAINFGRDGQ